jgi:hypothetical protein
MEFVIEDHSHSLLKVADQYIRRWITHTSHHPRIETYHTISYVHVNEDHIVGQFI